MVLCKAWMAPVIEGIAVVQQKFDVIRGAEDIENFIESCKFLGGLFYGVIGGYVMTVPDPAMPPYKQPKFYFLFSALNAVLLVIAAIMYPEDQAAGHSHNSHHQYSLKQKFEVMRKILGYWRVRRVILYAFFVTLTIVNFEVFLVYWNEEIVKITPFFEGSMDFIMLFSSSLFFMLYATKLSKVENKWFALIAILSRPIGLLVFYWLANLDNTQVRWGWIVNALFFQSITKAYLVPPAVVAFVKCIPHEVETLMAGFLGSIVKFNTEIVSRLMSLLFLRNKNISFYVYEGLTLGIAQSVIYSFIGLFALFLVFKRNEFVDLQRVLQKLAVMSDEEIKKLDLDNLEEFWRKKRETRQQLKQDPVYSWHKSQAKSMKELQLKDSLLHICSAELKKRQIARSFRDQFESSDEDESNKIISDK